MAIQAPPYKVYDAEGVFVCGAADLLIAQAVIGHAGWQGWNVRLGHSPRNVLFTEGTDGHAKHSVDEFVTKAEAALPKGKKPHTAKRLNEADSKVKQTEKAAAAKEAEKAKTERAAKRAAAATKTEEAPAKPAEKQGATVRPIRPAPKSAAKPRASKSAASKNVVHAKPTVLEGAGRVRKPAVKHTAAKR